MSRVHSQNCVGSRQDEGSALVEMAIGAAVFMTVIFGIIQACWALYAYNYVSQAAREATRYAIVRGGTYAGNNCTAPGPATCVAQAGSAGDISQYVKGLAYPGIDPNGITVTTTWPGGVGSVCSGAGCVNRMPGNLVQVVVSYPYSFHIPYVPAATFTMSSTSQLVISQ